MFEIGSSLRQARQSRSLELQDVAEATRIRVKYLAALEDERFGQLPEEVYARAFLRTYADFLGLDSEVFVAELNMWLEASRPPPPPPPAEPRFRLPSLDRRSLTLVGAAAGAVLAIVAAWRSGEPERVPVAELEAAAPPPKSSTGRPDTPKPAATPARGRLLLVASRGDCWLSVRAGSREGRVLYEGMLRRGEKVSVADSRVWIRVGAPWNLEARRNGRPLGGLPADTGNVLVTPTGVAPAS
jgi:cytoskeleton protein RodZ